MDVKTDMKVAANQPYIQAKEAQPPQKTTTPNNETGPKQNGQPVADKITISTQAVEAQKKNENVKGAATQAQKSQSLVNTII